MMTMTTIMMMLTIMMSIIQVRLEVGPVDRVAKEDINKFLREMVEESSSPGVVMISIIWLTMMVIVVMMIMVERLQAF